MKKTTETNSVCVNASGPRKHSMFPSTRQLRVDFLCSEMVGKRFPCSSSQKSAASVVQIRPDKKAGGPFQLWVWAATVKRTRVYIHVKESGCREGSESNEAEDDAGTSMVGVIWQCNRIVGLG